MLFQEYKQVMSYCQHATLPLREIIIFWGIFSNMDTMKEVGIMADLVKQNYVQNFSPKLMRTQEKMYPSTSLVLNYCNIREMCKYCLKLVI